MARQKNAKTEYYVAPYSTGEDEPEYNRLAKWITTVSDDTDEETETQGFYDGDGTPETDVTSVAKRYTFEGMYDDEDPAMKFIAGLEFETGEARKIMFRQVRTNGDTLEGIATVTEPKVTGGEATEYPEFSCAIAWDKKPEIVTGDSGE